MIEIKDIRISKDMPGFYGYVAEARLFDESQGGEYVTEVDPEIGEHTYFKWNYDKAFVMKFDEVVDDNWVMDKLGTKLTEILCDESL